MFGTEVNYCLHNDYNTLLGHEKTMFDHIWKAVVPLISENEFN